MAKYLLNARYTLDGVRGLNKEGGTSRRAVVEKAVSGLGGKVDAFYYAFGKDDVVVIVDLPDHETAAGLALTVGAAGGATVRTTVLLTPEQVDAATKKSVDYRPPGG
jgi:uncharacterized protein with GYD domain